MYTTYVESRDALVSKQLLRRYKTTGDPRARERLIVMHLPLVRSLAHKYTRKGEQLDDLVQVGSIGLIKSIDRFDMDRGVELTTYATPNIIGEIKRHFRDKGWAVRVPRGVQELNTKLFAANEKLTGQIGRQPTVEELAKATNSTVAEVKEALVVGFAYTCLSLSTQPESENSDGWDPMDALGGDDQEFERVNDRIILSSSINLLNPREKFIIHLRYFEELTQSQIASKVGISQMHVSRLIRRSVRRMSEFS